MTDDETMMSVWPETRLFVFVLILVLVLVLENKWKSEDEDEDDWISVVSGQTLMTKE